MRQSFASDRRQRLIRELAASPKIVSLWVMENHFAGTTVRDLVGVNHGAMGGSPTRGGAFSQKGFVAEASIAFPTTSDFVSTNDANSLHLTDGPFTLASWATRDSDSGAGEVLMDKGVTGGNSYAMGVDGSNDKLFIAKSGIAHLFESSATVAADGVVHDFWCTRNQPGAGNTHMYIDGVEGTGAELNAGAITDTTSGLSFGRLANSAAERWTGKQFVHAMWNRVLPASEVAYYHNLSFGG